MEGGELGGLWWLIMDVVLVAILAAAIIYGTMRWRRKNRSPAQKAETERVVKEHYEAPDRQG
ncbi:hypothetical protein [Rhodoligotrophos defluvii]|uniref:hypothetical protein n=1 Tax=Rhodoligotrophos defluvii TaxID=2561934 RepID=UPI0010C94719|nr:hypothetical protein [Rhodoligotrophos defluvii]